MKVKDIMHKGAVWVSPDTAVAKVARKMRSDDIGAVPVGENDRLVGMITDRDICCRALGNGRDPQLITARDVMTKPIVYCRADQTVEDAVAVMAKSKVRRLPVIDENRRLVGMLGLGDIAAKAAAKTASTALKTLAAHHA
jgi:CBS domain-containing protein